MQSDLDYLGDVYIDESALDTEWLMQPTLMVRYCSHSAACKQEVDAAKEQLEICKAKLDRQIRTNPEEYGLKKITEGAVSSAIVENAEHQECQQEYIEAKYEYERAVAAVRAIDQKKTALENLVRLHSASYFAGPSVPRDLSKEWEAKERSKKADNKVKISRRKK
jgi:hypothetical protein